MDFQPPKSIPGLTPEAERAIKAAFDKLAETLRSNAGQYVDRRRGGDAKPQAGQVLHVGARRRQALPDPRPYLAKTLTVIVESGPVTLLGPVQREASLAIEDPGAYVFVSSGDTWWLVGGINAEGTPGTQGPQGERGPQGPPGEDGGSSGSETFYLDNVSGTWTDFDLAAACPGIKTGDKVAIHLTGNLVVNSILLPETGCWLFFGIRDIAGGEWTLTIKDYGGGDSASQFRTPGAPEDTDVGPDFIMSSGEDWVIIGHTDTDVSLGFDGGWRIMARNSAGNNGLSTVGGPGVPARFDTTHSPLVLYHGAGDVLDYSGNGFNLSAGTNTFTQVLPNVKGLYSQTTANAPRRGAFDASLAITGDITIQAMVELYASPPLGSFVVSFTASGETLATNTLYQFGWNGSTQLRWLHESGAGATDQQFLSTGAIEELPELRKIYYIAAVRASDAITFYLNGLPFGSSSGTLTTASGGTSCVLNICGGGTALSFATLGVKVVGSALNAAQIKAEYNRTMGVAFGLLS